MEEADEIADDILVFHEDIQEENEEGVKEILHDFQADGLPIKELLTREVRLSDCDPPEWGMSAVHRAAAVGSTSILGLLLQAEPNLDLNLRVALNKLTPLHLATSEGQTAMVSYLAANGANVDAQDCYGRSPMHLAAERDHRDICQILGVKGVKVNIIDNKGQAPLHAACRKGHAKIINFLLKKDADINAQDELGQSGLHKAQIGGHLEVTEVMLGQKVKVDLQDRDGNTALHLAVNAFNNTHFSPMLVNCLSHSTLLSLMESGQVITVTASNQFPRHSSTPQAFSTKSENNYPKPSEHVKSSRTCFICIIK